MKKTVEREVEFCDICEKEVAYASPCLICGKVLCYECKKTAATEFHHAVYFSGSGDGLYCNECLSKPIPEEHIAVLQAYKTIIALINEATSWGEGFQARSKEAETKLKQLTNRMSHGQVNNRQRAAASRE